MCTSKCSSTRCGGMDPWTPLDGGWWAPWAGLIPGPKSSCARPASTAGPPLPPPPPHPNSSTGSAQAVVDVFATRVQDLTATFLEVSKSCGDTPAPQMRTFADLIKNGSEVCRRACVVPSSLPSPPHHVALFPTTPAPSPPPPHTIPRFPGSAPARCLRL